MKRRQDMLDERSPAGLEVFQLTEEPVPSAHVYMEAEVFTPDSRRLVLHRSAIPHGHARGDPEHRYLLCDLENNGHLSPLTHEVGATGVVLSPDGVWLYYFVEQGAIGQATLTLKRVRLDGTERQTLLVIDASLPGGGRPSRITHHPTLRLDGKSLAGHVFLGDGQTADADWGVMVVNLETGEAEMALRGPGWCNAHTQYCRSADPACIRDMLVQENHGYLSNAQGNNRLRSDKLGIDLHVVRDDGHDLRDAPIGRDGVELCQGHECWRGKTRWVAGSTQTRGDPACRLIEGLPAPHAGHQGAATPGARRNDLSRAVALPRFFHFGMDAQGARLITDCLTEQGQTFIYCARLGEPGQGPLQDFTYLLDARTPAFGDNKTGQAHPFLSPDGRTGFFNSKESGILQAYMIRGLPQRT